VFAVDGRNILTRIRRTDGQVIWPVPVGGTLDIVYGVTYSPQLEKVYVTTDSNLLVLDAANGSLSGKQRFESIASTPSVPYGTVMIYGARNGQVIWHNHLVGQRARAYQIAHAITIKPLLVGSTLIAVGAAGEVAAITADSASRIWGKNLLGAITAPPAAAEGVVYIASADQHLYAFDVGNGRSLWRYLSESPLTEPPTVLGDRVYAQLASEGLVCFAARPQDDPDGHVIWRAADVRGNVICRHGTTLFVWDAPRRSLTLVEEARGGVVDTLTLPGVRHLMVSALESGDLYAGGDDGRIVRLVPRSAAPDAEAAPPEAQAAAPN
jgi:outer membrane protein assembly factor BamB